ncbi:MAG: S49 family peptidase, partial [Cytophagaceae bacterium]
IIQESVERIYEDFLKVVAQGRGMERNDVHEIAQGRVWSGTDAKRINLTDVNGGLEDAIRLAAQKADLGDDYSVKYLPEIRDPFLGQLLRTFFDDREEEAYDEHLGQLAPYVKALKEAKKMEGVQARMPFVFYFE